jgi:hypothetical protein
MSKKWTNFGPIDPKLAHFANRPFSAYFITPILSKASALIIARGLK